MGERREGENALGGEQRPAYVCEITTTSQHLVVEHGGAEDAAILRPVDILRKDDARPGIRTRHYAGERGLERHVAPNVAPERLASCDVQPEADAEGDGQDDDEEAEEEVRLRGRGGGGGPLDLELLHFLAGGAAESGAGHGGSAESEAGGAR